MLARARAHMHTQTYIPTGIHALILGVCAVMRERARAREREGRVEREKARERERERGGQGSMREMMSLSSLC